MVITKRTHTPFTIYKVRKKNRERNSKAKEQFREQTVQKQLSQREIYQQALETLENVMITSHDCL